ncbi:hypothetical protein HZQ89_08685 [Elizabethkingia anophelis]|nr:hypothetical protein [Elizabethkingia anophelis]MCT4152790.1 hypothetical protein [Elizabethkingia anophelis]MCT4316719.1 hypothetical protein [Elizabethkingia anophelis]
MKNSKSHWRYQVINHGTEIKPSLAVHEMYFNTKHKSDCMWTQNPITLNNYDNLKNLIETLELILKNIKTHPILLESELEERLK